MTESLTEEEITTIIKGLIKTAHTSEDLKDDLFQDLYVYYLQLLGKFSPEMNIPLKAFLIKFLTWRMWTIVKKNSTDITVDLDTIQVEEKPREEELTSHDTPVLPSEDNTLLQSYNMPKEDLELLYLRHISGKSYQQLSELTKLSIEGIRKRIKKIERRLGCENRIKELKKNEK